MNPIQQERYGHALQHFLGAHEELVGLHREGCLIYEQYSRVATLVADAEHLLKTLVRGKEGPAGDDQTLPFPLWLFLDPSLSPEARWAYAHLLKLRRELHQPGRSGLVINPGLVSRDIFPTYAWTEQHPLAIRLSPCVNTLNAECEAVYKSHYSLNIEVV